MKNEVPGKPSAKRKMGSPGRLWVSNFASRTTVDEVFSIILTLEKSTQKYNFLTPIHDVPNLKYDILTLKYDILTEKYDFLAPKYGFLTDNTIFRFQNTVL